MNYEKKIDGMYMPNLNVEEDEGYTEVDDDTPEAAPEVVTEEPSNDKSWKDELAELLGSLGSNFEGAGKSFEEFVQGVLDKQGGSNGGEEAKATDGPGTTEQAQ